MTATARRYRRKWWVPLTIVLLVILIPLLLVGPPSRREPLLRLELVTDTLQEPVAMAGDPADPERLFVVERAGLVVLVEDGVRAEAPLLDLRDLVLADGLEQGLLGIALHPGFEENGRVFLYYTSIADEMVLAEYALGAPQGRILLSIPDPNPFHNGGQLAFGPDGHLYVGVGDGGLLPDGWRDGRDPASLLGKILRLDVDSPPATGLEYAIPADNPYVAVAGARPELWAIGLRNPWRFAFDLPSETLWIADVGQLKWEELDVVPIGSGGLDFGWNMYEGRQCFERESCDPTGLTMPTIVYAHSQANCAIVGGLVYRGPEGRLDGQYLLGDYCSGRIWTVGPGEQALALQVDTDLLITSFGAGADGNAYILAQGGSMHRIVQTLIEAP
ncbi:MAG TPA: PQQ-dependent sugar dehydrogenase [Candidatus Limnocylindria bacterium]|nr:PQQ-dependent sugar dehydrogenase [Candidatus Limnocylindria bacterium]